MLAYSLFENYGSFTLYILKHLSKVNNIGTRTTAMEYNRFGLIIYIIENHKYSFSKCKVY